MDNLSVAHSLTGMANSNDMIPLYSPNGSPFFRPIPAQPYPMLDLKSAYHSAWPFPYPEDTSSIDPYPLDHATTYLPNSEEIMNPQVCGPSFRCNQRTPKPLHQEVNAYVDPNPAYSSRSLACIQTNLQPAIPEALSPLNMASLHLTLLERPHRRYMDGTEIHSSQIHLPIPQPNPTRSSRNVVDQQQDKRLREAQSMGAPLASTGSSFPKPLLSLSASGDDQVSISEGPSLERQVSAHPLLPANPEGAMGYLSPTTSVAGSVKTPNPATQTQFDFSTSTLLDTVPAPALASTYSNFRRSNHQPFASTQTSRQFFRPSIYSSDTDTVSKHDSSRDEASSDGNVLDGLRFRPLKHAQSHSSAEIDNLRRKSFENADVTSHRISMSGSSNRF